MKRFLNSVGWLLGSAVGLSAGTVPFYENNSPVTSPPQIDATAFLNRSEFNVFTTLLYDFSNCLFYTNTGSGIMMADPGFRFDFVTNSTRLAADSFVNEGQITVATNLLVFATNILSSGDLFTGAGGIIQLRATNCVDVGRTGLRSGPTPQFFFFGGIFIGNFYENDPGVSDLYWGTGINNTLNNSGQAVPLTSTTNNFFFPNFGVPFTHSPSHQVLQAGFTFTNTVTLPGGLFNFFFSSNFYDVFVNTNSPTPTNGVIQIVFVNTNTPDPSFKTGVRFQQFFGDDRATVVVEWSSVDYDIVLQQFTTNYVYLTDTSATATNITLQRNFLTTTRRPSTYAVTRGTPFEWTFGTNGNAMFSNEMVFNSNYRSNRVGMRYAAYSAQIGEASTNGGFGFGLPFPPLVTEPTNMAGRIEIVADKVNLESTRVRAESLFSVKTRNLTSNFIAQVDAPFLIYDLTSIEPELVITNLAPSAVRRFSGQISAWTGLWTNMATNIVLTSTNMGTNTFTTNLIEIAFQALIVDNQLDTFRPVVLHEFAAHATNLVIGDNLAIGKSLLIDATNLHVVGGLALPPFANWADTNVHNLLNLTNDGTITISGAGYFGAVPAPPYSNFVNHGFITASTHIIRTRNFENEGSPFVANSGLIRASGGIISVDTVTANLTNSQLRGNGDIQIFADVLTNRLSTIAAGSSNVPGALILSVTNRLSDEGADADNTWSATAGFRVVRKAQTGDLLGTRLESTINRLSGLATHVWAGEDRGVSTNGFLDNMALGRLVLNGTNGSRFVFSPAGVSNALYVDYLELVNYATNYDTALQVNPGLTIYFANANVPPSKLNGRQNGRLRWVSSFTGPNSTTNITYPSGITYPFNIALVLSKDLDSDGDGIVNIDDPTPIFVPESVGLTVTITNLPPPSALISWNALANAQNYLDYTDDLAAPWQVLTNFVGGPLTTRVTVTDALPPIGMRMYRVRIQPP